MRNLVKLQAELGQAKQDAAELVKVKANLSQAQQIQHLFIIFFVLFWGGDIHTQVKADLSQAQQIQLDLARKVAESNQNQLLAIKAQNDMQAKIDAFQARTKSLEEDLATTHAAEAKSRLEAEALRRSLAEREARVAGAEDKAAKASEEMARKAAAAETLQCELTTARTRLAEIERQLSQQTQTQADLKGELLEAKMTAQAKADALTEERAGLQKAMEESRNASKRSAELEAEIARLRAALIQQEEAHKAQVKTLVEGMQTLQSVQQQQHTAAKKEADAFWDLSIHPPPRSHSATPPSPKAATAAAAVPVPVPATAATTTTDQPAAPAADHPATAAPAPAPASVSPPVVEQTSALPAGSPEASPAPSPKSLPPSSPMGTPSTPAARARINPADVPVPKGPYTEERCAQLLHTRENVVRELMETESNYVQQLNCLLTKFVEPMREKNLLDVQAVFPNMQNIRDTHLMLEGKLKIAGLNASAACDSLLTLGPFMKMYTSYVNGFMNSLQTLKEARNNNNSLKNFLKKQQQKFGNLDSLMIQPVQRIPRYELLLKEMLKNTPPDHPDREHLISTLIKMKEVGQVFNDCIKEKENLDKCNQVAVALSKPDLLTPSRRFVLEDELVLVPEGVPAEPQGSEWLAGLPAASHICLFNDALLLADNQPEGKLLYRDLLSYERGSIGARIAGPVEACLIEVTFSREPGHQQVLRFKATTPVDAGKWVEQINEAYQQSISRRFSFTTAASNSASMQDRRKTTGFLSHVN
ncbi:putative RhoGEF domain [Paratrimastix pyriformis]|uniref:RhoGEF domain n=1 Tax=Paratrimastix pyriformis TaxID=342808 RepID=A0ABQ8UHZ3_9EUKA|nr:putative RhoGEF domain [Paratrimastix pyriformis]